jgi:hypothetical protein
MGPEQATCLGPCASNQPLFVFQLRSFANLSTFEAHHDRVRREAVFHTRPFTEDDRLDGLRSALKPGEVGGK